MHNGNTTGRRKKGIEGIFKAVRTDVLPQINVKHQTIGPQNTENTKQSKCKTNQIKNKLKSPLLLSIQTTQKIKDKMLKGIRGKHCTFKRRN